MMDRDELLSHMSTHGPWEVKKTGQNEYQVVSGPIIVATVRSIWDAEFIVQMRSLSSLYLEKKLECKTLRDKIDRLEHPEDI